MAVGINLALGFAAFFSLFLFVVLALLVAVAGVADAAGTAVGFLYGLNALFDAAAAPPCLVDFLPEKLLLIFFFCFLTNCAVSKSSLRLLCLEVSNEVEIESFSVSLNFSIRWSCGVLACCHSLNIQ